jgi:hypothetical protein
MTQTLRKVAIAILVALSGACAKASLPTTPSPVTVFQTTQNRIVDDIGGDGVPGEVAPNATSQIVLMAAGGTLSASPDIFVFSRTSFETVPQNSQLPRFAEGTGKYAESATLSAFSFEVRAGNAMIQVWIPAPNGNYFLGSAVGEATIAPVTDATCASGVRLETRVTVNLEHFGRTEVEERHCALQ